jgi:hypothetical protein
MKNITIPFFITVLLIIQAVAAKAYNIEITSRGSTTVSYGQTVYIDIIFHPDSGGNMLGDYGFNILYDYSELRWNVTDTILSPPSPLSVVFKPFEDSGYAGRLNGISGLSSLSSQQGAFIYNPVSIATLAFMPVNAVKDGLIDVWLDTFSAGTGFTVDGQGISVDSMPASYSGVDISISSGGVTAPEPSGAVLFVAGMTVIVTAGKTGKDSMQ